MTHLTYFQDFEIIFRLSILILKNFAEFYFHVWNDYATEDFVIFAKNREIREIFWTRKFSPLR